MHELGLQPNRSRQPCQAAFAVKPASLGISKQALNSSSSIWILDSILW